MIYGNALGPAGRGAEEEEGAAEEGPEAGGEIAEKREHQGGAGGDAEGVEKLDIEGFADAQGYRE